MSVKNEQIKELVAQYHEVVDTLTRPELEALTNEIKRLRIEYQQELLEGLNIAGFTNAIVLEKRPGVWQIGADQDSTHYSVLSPDLAEAKRRWNNREFDVKNEE